MRRLNLSPRRGWQERVEKIGLTYHTHDTPSGPKPYWYESAGYEFTADEIDRLEAAIGRVHPLLIEAATRVVDEGRWEQLGIPAHAVPMIERSWNADDFSLYGRFDFAWMPDGEPKLLEYNADTPTSLVEASVAQWYWLQDEQPRMDQFNSIHERLIAAWKRYAEVNRTVQLIDFTSVKDNLEDEQTVSYLMDTAVQAGLKARWSAIGDIGWDPAQQIFVTSAESSSQPVVSCFKLYPWEWLFHEDFGQYLPDAPTLWIEPPWKALLSNKAILAIAWECFPDDPNLLPCFFDPAPLRGNHVRKPKLSREGANVSIVRDGRVAEETSGDYGEEGYVYQAIADIPTFNGHRPVFGGWVVDHEPAGLGIRESDSLVTNNVSRFVPHYFIPRSRG
ncbi:MAG TPA: glutathionylspermidine synthase family protein [Opitutaceae bacterium]|nr:glutathionylspermidine synthase family protein [Opitutaceae bacterium]